MVQQEYLFSFIFRFFVESTPIKLVVVILNLPIFFASVVCIEPLILATCNCRSIKKQRARTHARA